MPYIVCVGTVYIDTILSVPHFPPEDSKQRADNVVRRRGGNPGNTLEVLSRLLPAANLNPATSSYTTALFLLAPLPDPAADDTHCIVASLPDVSTRLYLYRRGHTRAASCYVLASAARGSRTCVSYDPLPGLSVAEFVEKMEALVHAQSEEVWVHFEGRGGGVLVGCMEWLRQRFGWHGRVRVSLECENPARGELARVLPLADVVFYSRAWAEAFRDPANGLPVLPASFLHSQMPLTAPTATLICTWGPDGAEALRNGTNDRPIHATANAWRPRAPVGSVALPVDTVGAGDTFIAGMLYALVQQPAWGLDQRLAFANELAGRKVYQEGFQGLGEAMRGGEWGERMGER
ncbi:Ribokinase-like protein [Boeremia exigua]|uniref:Ribokinase-like protein n=1 Tax=Boeremia exigua TaxID=749465 RepID=UPI001E8CE94B|nr:Ribokinase-like protein [Boeremia exigua]KAH6619948.1 Ribokinase-like protein [Boeremia exigua]